MKKGLYNFFFLFSLFIFSTACVVHGQDSSLVVSLDSNINVEFAWLKKLQLWAGKYEVTNAQYRKFMRFRDGTQIKGLALNADDQPAVFVSYCDAMGFCYWLNNNTVLPEGFEARLPSGEEWTYMITGGENRKYPWGNDWPPKSGNYLDKSGNKALSWEWFIPEYEDGIRLVLR